MDTPWSDIFEEMNTIVKMMGEECPKSIQSAFEYARKMRRHETIYLLRERERIAELNIKWMRV